MMSTSAKTFLQVQCLDIELELRNMRSRGEIRALEHMDVQE